MTAATQDQMKSAINAALPHNLFSIFNQPYLRAFMDTLPDHAATAEKFLPANNAFLNAVKAGMQAQSSFVTTVTQKTFESAEKIADLNLTTARATMEQSANLMQKLLAAKDAREQLALMAGQSNPAHAAEYGRHLANITSSARADIAKVTEEQLAETGRRLTAAIDEAGKNAPPGAETQLAIMKNVIVTAMSACEQFVKSSKQAADAVERNINTTTEQAVQAAEKITRAQKQ